MISSYVLYKDGNIFIKYIYKLSANMTQGRKAKLNGEQSRNVSNLKHFSKVSGDLQSCAQDKIKNISFA